MLQTTHRNLSANMGRILFGAFALLLGSMVDMQSARAGPNESNDRQSQCAWVQTSGSLAQTSYVQNLQPEPSEELLVSEDVNIITGLYTRSYSSQQNGIVDYKTARQIVISEYNEYWNTVVHTKEFPLLYWEDADHDGEFEMWVDQHGDGSPCDIIPYHMNDDPQNSRATGF